MSKVRAGIDHGDARRGRRLAAGVGLAALLRVVARRSPRGGKPRRASPRGQGAAAQGAYEAGRLQTLGEHDRPSRVHASRGSSRNGAAL
jgi:hypothetical protein